MPSMTRTIPLTSPPQSASDKGRNMAVQRSPCSLLEKEAVVRTRGQEQQLGVKKKTKTVVGRKTTGKKEKLVTHKSTKVSPNLGQAGGSKTIRTTSSKKKKKPPTPPEVEEVIDDDEDDDKDAEDDDNNALEDDDDDALDNDVAIC